MKTSSTHDPTPLVPNTCLSTANKHEHGCERTPKTAKTTLKTKSIKKLASTTPANVSSPSHLEAPPSLYCRRGHERERQANPRGAHQLRAKHRRVRPNTSKLYMEDLVGTWGRCHVRCRVTILEVEGLSPPTSPVSCNVYSIPSCTIDCP